MRRTIILGVWASVVMGCGSEAGRKTDLSSREHLHASARTDPGGTSGGFCTNPDGCGTGTTSGDGTGSSGGGTSSSGGTATALPDLVADGSDPYYCVRPDASHLTVTTVNRGTAAAAHTTTTIVQFTVPNGYLNAPIAVPILDAGASFSATVDIPSVCFSSDCRFSIQVDAYGEVVESNESNVFIGICLG